MLRKNNILIQSSCEATTTIKKGWEGSTASDLLMTRCLNDVNNCILKQTKHIATKQLSFSAVAFRP